MRALLSARLRWPASVFVLGFFLLLRGVVSAAPAPLPAGGTLIRCDFSDPRTWPEKAVLPAKGGATVTAAKVGTVDVAGGVEPSGGLRLLPGRASAAVGFRSGLIPVQNAETALGKLTLAFSLSASAARPVTVRVESFDAARKRTGGLETQIFPAAPDFYQRYALDLSTLKPVGSGKFQPTAPFVQFTYVSPDGSALLLDNVQYARPAYYVSPKGSDTNDGRTEKTAFATPQKAVDVAGPGDILLLMEGTYNTGLQSVVSFVRAGAPDAWITLKNYPGQTPTLTCNGWNTVSIARGSKEAPDETTILAYLEIRGLHVRGEADIVRKKFPDSIGKSDSRSNTNGIAIDGRYMKNVPHHIRIADNLVEYCPAEGMGPLEADWVTMEHNVSRFNCWTSIYGTSGVSILGASNFDGLDNVYKMLVRDNIVYRNQTYEDWEAVKHPSDGNGIILDINQKTDDRPNGSYRGRTLVQGNLSFDNGGSGIHTVRANRVDIINNTTYLNSANDKLEYGQIFTYESDDVRIMNNILVAPVANIAAGEKPEPVNKGGGKNSNVVFSHNVYFGGNVAPTMGEGDVIADPQFVRPSRDKSVADFHLKNSSPAKGTGIVTPFLPYLDLDGLLRLPKPSRGAYQK